MLSGTREIGPRLQTRAPDFSTLDHNSLTTTLQALMGERGLVLGFTGDIWQPASVRRVLWFQRHVTQFHKLDVNMALVICNEPSMLHGFSMSSKVPLLFPLLSDVNHRIHTLYNVSGYAGMVILDKTFCIRDKWIMPDERVWPKAPELQAALAML